MSAFDGVSQRALIIAAYHREILDLFGWRDLTIIWRTEARRAGLYASKDEVEIELRRSCS
jgi:hypothetical protein